MIKPKLLILSPRFPFPLEKGDKLRLYNQIRFLSPYFDIHLVALSEEDIQKNSLLELERFTCGIDVIQQSSARNVFAVIQSLVYKKSLQTAYYHERKIGNEIKNIIQRINPDIIHVQLIRMADYVINIPVSKSLDYMDAMSLNMKRESEKQVFPLSSIYSRESRLLKRKEKEFSALFDLKWIISEPDKKYLNSLGVDNLQVQANGVDTDFFDSEILNTEKLYDIAFVGNMGYFPNIAACEYLVNNILPSFKSKPTVLLAGARPHKRVKALVSSGVEISGWLEDIRLAYSQAKILVAPIFSGAGQQNKILEAMSMKMACITTTQVNNAIGATPYKEIMLADSEKEFHEAIDYLLKNPAKRREIAKNARIFVERNFDWQTQVGILRKALYSLLEKE